MRLLVLAKSIRRNVPPSSYRAGSPEERGRTVPDTVPREGSDQLSSTYRGIIVPASRKRPSYPSEKPFRATFQLFFFPDGHSVFFESHRVRRQSAGDSPSPSSHALVVDLGSTLLVMDIPVTHRAH